MMSTTRRFPRALALGSAMTALALASVVNVAPANASGTGATCPEGRFCLYFNSDLKGARADLAVTDAALTNELFDDGPVGANGWKVVVNNNAASYWNRTGKEFIVFDGQKCTYGETGMALALRPGTKGSLNSSVNSIYLKNKVSSIKVVGPGIARTGCSTYPDQSKY